MVEHAAMKLVKLHHNNELSYQRVACSGSHRVDRSTWFHVRRVVFVAVRRWPWRHERRLRRTQTAHCVCRRVVHSSMCLTPILVDCRAWSWREDCHAQTDRQTDRQSSRHTASNNSDTDLRRDQRKRDPIVCTFQNLPKQPKICRYRSFHGSCMVGM